MKGLKFPSPFFQAEQDMVDRIKADNNCNDIGQGGEIKDERRDAHIGNREDL